MLWHIGNTTVRTPYRLRGALIALQGTQLHGHLQGRESEVAFAQLLHESEVVDVQRIAKNPEADVSDLGRKWRVALSQLGFITHGLKPLLLNIAIEGIQDLSGRPYEITPNGYRLIQSESITAQQECFLRSLLAYQIPSIIEPRYKCNPFNPLKFVIDILYELNSTKQSDSLSMDEFALFVQTATPSDEIDQIVQRIIQYRNKKVKKYKSSFYKQAYQEIALTLKGNIPLGKLKATMQTLDDYADLSFRYLKATGLFRARGHSITLNPAKSEILHLLHDREDISYNNDVEYLVTLWKGASLPTDNATAAVQVINSLEEQIAAKGAMVTPLQPSEDVSIRRHVLEEQLLHLEEIEYYRNQATEVSNIIAWMEAFLKGSAKLSNGDLLKVPKGEAPAYLEWVIWRAFLAMNSLENNPWDARRFQIDQDFLPVNTAPGNGPDMVFEFRDVIIVVEVTLTTSSRQEAAEGEPVRRHVAHYAEAQRASGGKIVYGLFIALNIDNNTAHTFRMGDWYLSDNTKINLHIVPLSLNNFYKLFANNNVRLHELPNILRNVILNCRAQANQDAPAWKESITHIIDRVVGDISTTNTT